MTLIRIACGVLAGIVLAASALVLAAVLVYLLSLAVL